MLNSWGIPLETYKSRLNTGWSLEKILTTIKKDEISYNTFRDRLNQGLSREEALNGNRKRGNYRWL